MQELVFGVWRGLWKNRASKKRQQRRNAGVRKKRTALTIDRTGDAILTQKKIALFLPGYHRAMNSGIVDTEDVRDVACLSMRVVVARERRPE